MKKFIKININTAFFILGITVAAYSSTFFSDLIMNLYKWSSNGNIHFTGKFITFLSFNPIYLLSFGFSFLLFSLEITTQETTNLIKKLFLQFSIFILMLVCISSFDAIGKLASCTACDDGILTLNFNKISFVLILSISVLCSSIPTFVRIIRNKKKS
ncbi:hypothetical protein Fleli_3792 [Bernardetia litoralis DSM 6794]|uniref:Uncharacterized protein n=1 Tax=Bernardetia litoralis (strain ATCC 23117 / DSM 6794 / NBRC 15988 / NCIMB 1366 / Fx l1 / Sio-4) TaxID=880071 RepID=I4AQ67_BERLS|nr:hypothetical protein [Bernardetia litoralis]AFM06102.1 hypothetical protein Fleli_3792 [Bernardetia litoralis DSM 6794]